MNSLLLNTVVLGALGISWLVSVTSAVQLVRSHRAEGRSISDYLAGPAWFGADAFAPSGAPIRRRMHLALIVFFGIAFVGAAVVLVAEVL